MEGELAQARKYDAWVLHFGILQCTIVKKEMKRAEIPYKST